MRWDHNEGSKVNVMRDSRRMFHEVRLIRRQAGNGFYDAAIAAARVGAKDRERALHTSGAPSSKNESPSELASAFKADAGD